MFERLCLMVDAPILDLSPDLINLGFLSECLFKIPSGEITNSYLSFISRWLKFFTHISIALIQNPKERVLNVKDSVNSIYIFVFT